MNNHPHVVEPLNPISPLTPSPPPRRPLYSWSNHYFTFLPCGAIKQKLAN